MGKKFIKCVILLAVFFGALTGFSLMTDTHNVEITSEMPEVTLPVIYLQKEEIYINELYGHKGEMDSLSIRDTITPLAEDLVIPVTIRAFECQVESISYEVRTLDTTRLLQQNTLEDYKQKDGLIETELKIQNLLEKEKEYQLKIILQCNKQEVCYYTRIIASEHSYIDESLEFVLDFYDMIRNPQRSARLATFLEPSGESDNTTLQNVNIHSSLRQVAWADLKGEVLRDPIPSIQEINDSYNTVELSYVLASNGENGETEFFNVKEYYRIRYSSINQRMYLLNYERKVNEIFKGHGDHFDKTSLLLGIRDIDVSYMLNENGTIIAFVQQGDLWSYNSTTNQLSLVYSFRGVEEIDDRENRQEYDIRIMKVDEAGNIDFAVYGYMNRGEYEGYTGIGVYHYDGMANTIQEGVFVQSPKVYQILKDSWGKLFYVSEEGYFYFIAEQDLYQIYLADGKTKLIQSGLTEENSAVSKEGRYVAFRKNGQDSKVTIMDLETGAENHISGEPGTSLTPIGFVESDFVYGIGTSDSGHDKQQLLQKIMIIDKDRQLIKEYEKSGFYITEAYVENTTVYLERVKKIGPSYVKAESDAIKSHEIESARNIRIETYTQEPKQKQVKIALAMNLSEKAPRLLTPKEVVQEKKKVITLKNTSSSKTYFVYLGSQMILSTSDLAEAIQSANGVAGVVVTEQRECIWRRGRKTSISLTQPEILEQEKQVLEEAEQTGTSLELTGCTLDQVLYYVGKGSIVSAVGENNRKLYVVGYDEINVILYDPLMDTTEKMGLQQGEKYFQDSGNLFISYYKAP